MFQGVVLRAHICPKAGTPKPCFPKMKAPNSSVVGGCLRTDCTAASTDGDFIFVSSDSAVRMYGARTGDRVLDLHGHAAEVTAICVDPANKQQIYSSSMDCTIRKWNFEEKACVACIQLEAPVVHMVMVGPDMVVAALQCRGGKGGKIGTYCLKKKVWTQLLRVSSHSCALALSPSMRYIATFERYTLHVVEIAPNEANSAKLKLAHTKRFTDTFASSGSTLASSNLIYKTYTIGGSCVAFDCTNEHVAAGDASGRINIWTGLEAATAAHKNGQSTDPRTAGMRQQTIHWHSNAVQSLCFTQDGCYLLSGGHEGVLVIWQLATLSKTFLARLGGAICHISPFPRDPTQYVLGFDTNVIRCVSLSAMKTNMTVYGLRPSALGASEDVANKGITIQPGSGFLALPCVGSQLQLYDCVHDCHVARVQVTKRNMHGFTDERSNVEDRQYREPAVELAAFTHDAATLVTLESMPRECSGGSERWQSLKFWDVHSTGSGQTGYTVNSFVDDPSFGTITSLACHPTDVLVATTCVPVRQGLGIGSGEGVSGQTGSVRLWRKRHFRRPPGAPADSPTWHWRCSTARTYKDQPMHCCAFSHDGSTLAVGGSTCTSLWTCDGQFIASLVCPFEAYPGSRVSHTCFIKGTSYLVTAHSGQADSAQGLCVWNLLNLTLVWTTEGAIYDIAAHPSQPQFACIMSVGDKRVVGEFEADHGSMVCSWGQAAADRPSRVLYAPAGSALAARRQGSTPLLVVSEKRSVMVVPSYSKESQKIVSRGKSEQARITDAATESQVNVVRSGAGGGKLSDMFGHDRSSPSPDDAAEAAMNVRRRERAAALAAALPMHAESHLLPPVSELCSHVLQALVGPSNDEVP